MGAEETWPAYQAPERPSGGALLAEVTEWKMGKENEAMIHDLEVGRDGKIYTVDMLADAISVLDPVTGERENYTFPGGKDYNSTDGTVKGPHSVEVAPNGDLWFTLAISGEMAKFDHQDERIHGRLGCTGASQARRLSAYPCGLRRTVRQGLVDRCRTRVSTRSTPRATP